MVVPTLLVFAFASHSTSFLLFIADACIIVANYVDQLDEEKSYPATKSEMPGGVVPVTTYNSYGGTNYSFTPPVSSRV